MRWPHHIRDRHASKITIYGWSTKPLDPPSLQDLMARSFYAMGTVNTTV
jgi:hypothetical protein